MAPIRPLLTSRLARARREDGYVMVFVLGLLILLVATSVLVLGATKGQIVTARENERFTNARQATDDGFAAALAAINTNPMLRNLASGSTVTGTSTAAGGRGPGVRGEWAWDVEPYRGLLNVSGNYDGTVETRSLPFRWRAVGSQSVNSSGGVVYGIAANGKSRSGVWSSVLASAVDSVANGSFVALPTVSLYGASQFNLSTTTGSFSAVYYSDNASVTSSGHADRASRSQLTAKFDFNRLNARATHATSALCTTLPAANALTGGYGCSNGNFSVPSTVTSSAGGTKTIVIKGDLTIPHDLNYTGASQLHLYVTGNVTFSQGSGSTAIRKAYNTFIFAPNGTCKTDTGVSLDLRGSLACNEVDLKGNSNTFRHVFPVVDIVTGNEGPGSTSLADLVFYTESAGYVDSRTNF